MAQPRLPSAGLTRCQISSKSTAGASFSSRTRPWKRTLAICTACGPPAPKGVLTRAPALTEFVPAPYQPDAEAAGLQPGRRIVPTRAKTSIENDMRRAAQAGLTDTDRYRALEAELQAAIEGRPLADVGVHPGQAPNVESLLKAVDDVVRDGTEFVPTRFVPYRAPRNASDTGLVTDGVAYFSAKYVRELPKGAVIKYTNPEKAAAVLDENGELIGMLMPVRGAASVDDVPAGKVQHPVHGLQDGWKFTDAQGNTYHLYHKVGEEKGVYYQRPEDKPKGPKDYGWWLELRTKAMGPDSMSQSLSIRWAPDGTLQTHGAGDPIEVYGKAPADEVKQRMIALADRAIDEHDLPLDKVGQAPEEAAAAAPEAAPSKVLKLPKGVYTEVRERLGLPEPISETKTLVRAELTEAQFKVLIDDLHALSKGADETMSPGAAAAAKRKYRDAMQTMWDQGAPPPAAAAAPEEAAAAADEVAPAVEEAAPAVDDEQAARIAEHEERMAKYDEESRALAQEPWWQEMAAQQRFITELPDDGPIKEFAPADDVKALKEEMSRSHFLPIDEETPVAQAYSDAQQEALAKYHAGEMTWSEQQDFAQARATELYLEYRELAPIPQPRDYWKSIGVMDRQARYARSTQKGGEYVIVLPSNRRLGAAPEPQSAAAAAPTPAPPRAVEPVETTVNPAPSPIPAAQRSTLLHALYSWSVTSSSSPGASAACWSGAGTWRRCWSL